MLRVVKEVREEGEISTGEASICFNHRYGVIAARYANFFFLLQEIQYFDSCPKFVWSVFNNIICKETPPDTILENSVAGMIAKGADVRLFDSMSEIAHWMYESLAPTG